MYKILILLFLFEISTCSQNDLFNITITMPNIGKTLTNHSIYIAMKLPIDEELYIVDFQPIYDRQKVHFISTYLCPKPYLLKEKYWFAYQPCHNAGELKLIYEWYYNVPAVQWPKDAAFQVGVNTPYRYVVLHIRYFQYDINDIYGQQIILTRRRPAYKIGTYEIITNSGEFSCRYSSSNIQMFSTQFYTNSKGRSISLYRLRNNELQPIVKGNLNWPQTFYQLENSVDIKDDDYLIGTCVYEENPLMRRDDRHDERICQITIIFLLAKDDNMTVEMCLNNDYYEIVKHFRLVETNIPPETLHDINPTYPKLSPDEWAKMNVIASTILPTKPIDTNNNNNNNTNLLFLDYLKEAREHATTVPPPYRPNLTLLFSMWGLVMSVGFLILFIVILQSRKNPKYIGNHNNQNTKWSRSIAIGGDLTSLSNWLTPRLFQQNDQDEHDHIESQPLTQRQHRWASESEESDISDNDVFDTSDLHHIILKN